MGGPISTLGTHFCNKRDHFVTKFPLWTLPFCKRHVFCWAYSYHFVRGNICYKMTSGQSFHNSVLGQYQSVPKTDMKSSPSAGSRHSPPFFFGFHHWCMRKWQNTTKRTKKKRYDRTLVWNFILPGALVTQCRSLIYSCFFSIAQLAWRHASHHPVILEHAG